MEDRVEESLSTASVDSRAAPAPSSPLPEDDGMESLRQKMREIHDLATSTEDKARKMHLLMTRDYNAIHNKTALAEAEEAEEATETLRRTPTADNPYNIHPDDLVPSYCPEPVADCDDEDNPTGGARFPLGCQHYSRNVKIQCYDCKLWFPCRHCHDSSDHLPYPHQLNRQKTQNMLCMHCQTPQPAGETCMNCNEETAYYYCSKCKLWDNDSTKRIYHCDDCGICRRGEGLGKDYVHCKRCNVCISISTSQTHPCIERATDCDCPLCLDYLFSSPQPVVSLLCGHYMHASCYKDLMRVTYRCPVCNKSAVNMELQWRKLDDEIRMQPMPEEDFEPLTPLSSRPPSRQSSTVMSNPDVVVSSSPPRNASADANLLDPTTEQLDPNSQSQSHSQFLAQPQPQPHHRRLLPRRVWIGCNDCGGRGYAPFHWLGLRCSVCDGYNTTQMTPLGNASLSPLGTPSLRALSSPYTHQRQHDFTGVDAIRSFGDGSGEGGAAGLGVDSFANGEEAAEMRADSAYEAEDRGWAHWPEHLGRGQEGEWVANADLASGRSYFFRAELEEAAAAAAAAAAAGNGASSGFGSGFGGYTGVSFSSGFGSGFAGYAAGAGGVVPVNLGNLSEGLRERAGLLRPDRALSASAQEMFGRVRPYEMVMRLGRSLSPMRYYIEGLDLNHPAEEGIGGGHGSRPHTAASEDHGVKKTGDLADAGETAVGLRKAKSSSGKGGNDSFWGSDGRFLGVWQSSSDNDDAENEDEDDDEEEGEEGEEGEDSEEDSADEDGDGADEDEDEDDDDDDIDHLLPGHL